MADAGLDDEVYLAAADTTGSMREQFCRGRLLGHNLFDIGLRQRPVVMADEFA